MKISHAKQLVEPFLISTSINSETPFFFRGVWCSLFTGRVCLRRRWCRSPVPHNPKNAGMFFLMYHKHLQICKPSRNVSLCVFQFLKVFTCDQFSETYGWQQPTGFKFNYISFVPLLETKKT